MLSAKQWKQDCFDGIVAAHLSKTIKVWEGGKLRLSIKEPVDEVRMNADTRSRTGGACPMLRPSSCNQVGKLAEIFERLRRMVYGG